MSDENETIPTCTAQQREEFEQELKSMDWYYEMADDNKTWSAGQRREIELRNKALRLGLYSLFKQYKEGAAL